MPRPNSGLCRVEVVEPVEVAVDGGPGDAELGGDLGDGELAGLVHLPRQPGLAVAELGPLPAGAAPRAGGVEAVVGALRHQGVLELGDGAEDLEEHPPDRGGGVDTLIEHHQVDLLGAQLVGQLDQVLQRAAEPVELGHHKMIPGPEPAQGLVELGPAGELAGSLVGEDAFAAGRAQRVGLGLGVLVAGGDPRVADPNPGNVSRTGVCVT